MPPKVRARLLLGATRFGLVAEVESCFGVRSLSELGTQQSAKITGDPVDPLGRALAHSIKSSCLRRNFRIPMETGFSIFFSEKN